MTRRKRRVLFSVLTLFFIILVPSIILYSQGWRFDLATTSITRTGGVYVKTTPVSSEVYIDGVLRAKTDFLFGTSLTENLVPGTYEVVVQKPGHHPWKKELTVTGHQVTEVKNIILFPDSLSFQSIADSVIALWPSPNSQEVILQRQTTGSRWEIVLFELATGREEPIFTQTHAAQDLRDVQWDAKGERIILQLGIGEALEHRVIAFEESESASCREEACSLSFVGGGIAEIQFDPTHATRLILTKQIGSSLSLLEVDYETETVSSFLVNNVITFATQGSQVIWLTDQGDLWQRSLNSDSPATQLTATSFPIRQETPYTLRLFADTLFLQEESALFSLQDDAFREIAQNIHALSPSPDTSKLGIATNTEIFIYFLREHTDQPQHQKEDLLFLTRLSQPITGLEWLTSNYILFSVNDVIRAAEIDERSTLNITDIASFQNPQLLVQPSRNILHVLSQGTLSASERITK